MKIRNEMSVFASNQLLIFLPLFIALRHNNNSYLFQWPTISSMALVHKFAFALKLSNGNAADCRAKKLNLVVTQFAFPPSTPTIVMFTLHVCVSECCRNAYDGDRLFAEPKGVHFRGDVIMYVLDLMI